MSTKQTVRKFVTPVAAALMFALGSTAYAVTPQQSPDQPVDCKKTPDHERCKDKK